MIRCIGSGKTCLPVSSQFGGGEGGERRERRERRERKFSLKK